jgi:NAD binding domain of 6-phosphogluconate dehydrogenase
MKVGFIGLGQMGSGMAASLLRAGHEVTVYNRSAEKRRPLLEIGAREAATVADACAAGVVLTMLSGDEALRQVALADEGIIAGLREGGTHVSMSTVSVELTRYLAQAHAQARQRFIAAPVFGRPEMAAAAKLFIVAAGAPETLSACQPLFDAMGQRTFPLGTEPSRRSGRHSPSSARPASIPRVSWTCSPQRCFPPRYTARMVRCSPSVNSSPRALQCRSVTRTCVCCSKLRNPCTCRCRLPTW